MDAASEAPASVAFGRFRVLPQRRELLAEGQPIKLGGRAFDVLMALIEARGAVLGKDVLMARVPARPQARPSPHRRCRRRTCRSRSPS
jgi:DNA-binding response OmpR family regulator